jgi:hypothetical protein
MALGLISLHAGVLARNLLAPPTLLAGGVRYTSYTHDSRGGETIPDAGIKDGILKA